MQLRGEDPWVIGGDDAWVVARRIERDPVAAVGGHNDHVAAARKSVKARRDGHGGRP
jgi:hypothetical protein